MYTDTEGIILRQTKTLNGRRMIVLFTGKYGKISAGTSLSEKGRTKSGLALRPFCRGKYELYKNRGSYSINGTEVIESYYALGEDVDKFMAASRILEFTDALLGEDEPQPALYSLLCDYLSMMTLRKGAFETLDAGFQIKAMQLSGCGINVKTCCRCQKKKEGSDNMLSVAAGGLVCGSCRTPQDSLDPLIFNVTDDIISVVDYISSHPLKSLEKLAIPEKTAALLERFLSSYRAYHLGIDRLKSDGLD